MRHQTRVRAARALHQLTRLAGRGVLVPGPPHRWRALRGPDASFISLPVGHHRLMCELRQEEELVLVLGVVHGSRLVRWVWSGALPDWRIVAATVRNRPKDARARN